MKGHGEKLSRKQELAIAALLAEPSRAAAASRCGVGETTLWRWLQTEEFQAAYRSARRRVVENVITNLQQAGTKAVDCLRRNLSCGQASVEVRAATAILGQVLGDIDLLDLEERLRRLEALPEVRDA